MSRTALLVLGLATLLLIGVGVGVTRDSRDVRFAPESAEAEASSSSGLVAPTWEGRREELEAKSARLGGAPNDAGVPALPSEGALLELRFLDAFSNESLAGVEFEVAGERRVNAVFATGVSDEHGRAVIDRLPRDVWLVRSKRMESHAARVSGLWFEGTSTEHHDVRLEPGWSAIVEVVDDLGAPVAGALVERRSRDRRHAFANEELGRTGADGRLEIQHLADLAQEVWIENGKEAPRAFAAPELVVCGPDDVLPGFEVNRAVNYAGETVVVRVLIPRAIVVRGEVVEVDGTPIEGALITRTLGSGDLGAEPLPHEAVTARDGSFSTRLPDRGKAQGLAVHTSDGRRQAYKLPDAEPGDELSVELVLDASRALIVELFDRSTGERLLRPPLDLTRNWERRDRGALNVKAHPSTFSRRWPGWVRWIDGAGAPVQGFEVHSNGEMHVRFKREPAFPAKLHVGYVGFETSELLLESHPSESRLRVELEPLSRWAVTVELAPDVVLPRGFTLRIHACERPLLRPHSNGTCGCSSGVSRSIPLDARSLTERLPVPLNAPLFVHLAPSSLGIDLPGPRTFGPFVPSRGPVRVVLDSSDLEPLEADDSPVVEARPPPMDEPQAAPSRAGELLLRILDSKGAPGAKRVEVLGDYLFSWPRELEVLGEGLWSRENHLGDSFSLQVKGLDGGMHWSFVEAWQPGVEQQIVLSDSRDLLVRLSGFEPRELAHWFPVRLEPANETSSFPAVSMSEVLCTEPGTRQYRTRLAPGSYRLAWEKRGAETELETVDRVVPSGEGEFSLELAR